MGHGWGRGRGCRPQKGRIERSEIARSRGRIERSEIARPRGRIERSEIARSKGRIERSEIARSKGRIERSEIARSRGRIERSEIARPQKIRRYKGEAFAGKKARMGAVLRFEICLFCAQNAVCRFEYSCF